MLKKFILGAAALTATTTALPAAAEARHYDGYGSRYARGYDGYDRGYYDRGYYNRGYRGDYRRGYDYDDRRYYARRRCGSGTTGAIIGGAAGALLGREIARGDRRGYRYRYRRGNDGTVGAILGGAVGALIGNEIGRSC